MRTRIEIQKRKRFHETVGFYVVHITQALVIMFALYAMTVVTLAM